MIFLEFNYKERSAAFGRNQSGETASMPFFCVGFTVDFSRSISLRFFRTSAKNDFMEKAGFLTPKKDTAIPTQRPEFLKNVRRPRKK